MGPFSRSKFRSSSEKPHHRKVEKLTRKIKPSYGFSPRLLSAQTNALAKF